MTGQWNANDTGAESDWTEDEDLFAGEERSSAYPPESLDHPPVPVERGPAARPALDRGRPGRPGRRPRARRS